MDIVTLGAALNGSKRYVNSHFKGGSNIQIVNNPDGTQTINASGEVSAEDTVAREAIVEHVLDKANPHEVTAAQVGLGNVDNTSDIDKPVSTAVQAALNAIDLALDSKQNVITDLSNIRSGAALGATAVQPVAGKGLSTNDYTTEEKNKLAAIEAQANKTVVDSTLNSSSTNPVQNKVVKSALDNKQASLTAPQLAAVNSGITSADVDQIETNKNNISSVQEQANWNSSNGVKNICPYNSGATSGGEGTVWNNLPIDIAAGTYSVSFSTDAMTSALVLLAADGVTEVLRKTYSTTTVNDTFTISVAAKYIRLYIGASKTVSNFMIRAFGDDTFVPYALSNAELTAAAVELVDNGAKNKLSIGTPTSVPSGLTCVRNDDGTYTVSGTLSAPNSISFNIDAIDGNLVLSGCPEGGGNDTYLLRITKSGSQVTGSVDVGNGSNVFTMDGTEYALNIRFSAGTYTNVIFKPMICSKAAWDISQSYQPYRPSYQELYEIIKVLRENQ